MLRVTVEGGSRLAFTDPATNTAFSVAFQRTLRIPDNGKDYPLPPGLGSFPVRRVLAHRDRVPADWVKTSGVFLPMYQREAMWVSFQARHWRPNAVKVAAGKVNAVSGRPWDQTLHPPDRAGRGEPTQDYLTCPPQPWLDGFNTAAGAVRQFVAMPLGMGYTVEGQVTGEEKHGGVQLIVYEPKPGRFPDKEPEPRVRSYAEIDKGGGFMGPAAPAAAGPFLGGSVRRKASAMGLAGGGKITQKIYPDPHGVETWDEANFGRVFVHIVDSQMWAEITGETPPPSPVDARTYTQHGFPWFKLYDEPLGDLPAAGPLAGVKSVAQKDAEHGFVGLDDNDPVDVPAGQVRGLGVRHPNEVPDGEW